MRIASQLCTTILAALSCLHIAAAAVTWDFKQSASPKGSSTTLLAGTPAFAAQNGNSGLAPNTELSWQSVPELQIQPGIAIACKFYLHELRPGVQILAMKDGEYILRVDWEKEGGHLSFFVMLNGAWENRIRGPVVSAQTWYDVRVCWTGQTLNMSVNGESYRGSRMGSYQQTDEPLLIGPIAGVIDSLAIHNPAGERLDVLRSMVAADEIQAPFGARSRWERLLPWTWSKNRDPNCSVIGGKQLWDAWQTKNGMDASFRSERVTCQPSSPGAMLVSPPLNIAVAATPFLCLDIAEISAGQVGYLDVISDSGRGCISFEVAGAGTPTIITGSQSQAWTGTIRRLALSFADPSPVVLTQATLADRPIGQPSLYIRSLAPGRAKLRPGREESVILGLQNVGGEAEDITVSLRAPRGVKLLGKRKQTIAYLGMDDFAMATWHVSAKEPGNYPVILDAKAGKISSSQELTLSVEPWPELPPHDYVPTPIPATTDYINLMHYCALWKEGTHYGWQRIEPWPERRPAIGWYDEGTPEVADWHIKYALEHGINGFIYCWYRADYEAEITHRLGHAIHDGLFNAKYREMFNFTIMWENGCAKGVKDEADLLDNVLPFWIKNYFSHPSYLKIDNQPVLFVWQPRPLIEQLGGTEKTTIAFAKMREQCRQHGFAGLRIIACMPTVNKPLGKLIAASGWDALSGYNLQPAGVPIVGYDPAGLAYKDHADVLSRYKQTWIDRAATVGDLPDIPNVVMGRDDRAWGRIKRGSGSYIANPQAKNFAAACRDAKELVDAKPAGRWDSKIVVFDNWTEFGEGHYIEPTTGTGFSFVNAIKQVFCSSWAPEEITDIIPEDLGMAPPQRRYEAVRAGYGKRLPWLPLRISGDLIAHWEFDGEDDGYFLDSSPNGCDLKIEGIGLAPGRKGQALLCGKGGAVIKTPAVFYHPGGISIALWCNPSEPEQSDRWLINTAGTSHGYRIGLNGGKLTWQIPREAWSHSLSDSQALAIKQWSHVAATFDNQTMRLYINGQEVAKRERQGFIKKGDNFVVGAYSASSERNAFQGLIDDVRIYRRVLNADEIAKLAQ
jgi:hypothetical protein